MEAGRELDALEMGSTFSFRWLAEAVFGELPKLGETVDLYLATDNEMTELIQMAYLGSVVVGSLSWDAPTSPGGGPHTASGAFEDYPKPHRIVVDAKRLVTVTIRVEEWETYPVKADLSPEVLEELWGEDTSRLESYSVAQRVIGRQDLVGEPSTASPGG